MCIRDSYNATLEQREITLRIALHGIVYSVYTGITVSDITNQVHPILVLLFVTICKTKNFGIVLNCVV